MAAVATRIGASRATTSSQARPQSCRESRKRLKESQERHTNLFRGTLELQKPIPLKYKSFSGHLLEHWQFVDDSVAPTDWSLPRQHLTGFFNSPIYDLGLAVLLALNMGVVVIEVDGDARGEGPPEGLELTSFVLTGIWSFEMLCRIYVFRLDVFMKAASIVEFCIVLIDVVMTMLGRSFSVLVFRFFRLARLVRALRIMTLFPELHLMMKGLIGALNAVIWGCLFLTITLMVWSILFVVAVHPLNKEIDYGDCARCTDAFSSVSAAFITFSQTVIAGDSWGMVAIPLIEAHPWVGLLLVGVFVSISLCLMNLILAVILDAADRARSSGDRQVSEQKAKQFAEMSRHLKTMCESMDEDSSGELTLEEIIEAFDKEGEFYELMVSLDIKRSDLEILFNVMDRDKGGTVDYDEFVQQMTLVKGQDSNTTLFIINHQITECHNKLQELDYRSKFHRSDASRFSSSLRDSRHPSFYAGKVKQGGPKASHLTLSASPYGSSRPPSTSGSMPPSKTSKDSKLVEVTWQDEKDESGELPPLLSPRRMSEKDFFLHFDLASRSMRDLVVQANHRLSQLELASQDGSRRGSLAQPQEDQATQTPSSRWKQGVACPPVMVPEPRPPI